MGWEKKGDYVNCLRKEVYWMGDREDYITCLSKEGFT